jgi:DNA-binding Lrp family transcriptional regulator
MPGIGQRAMPVMALDAIDRALLAAIKADPGQAVYVLLRSFTARSKSILRRRLDILEDHGYVRLDRTSQRGRVFYPVEAQP